MAYAFTYKNAYLNKAQARKVAALKNHKIVLMQQLLPSPEEVEA